MLFIAVAIYHYLLKQKEAIEYLEQMEIMKREAIIGTIVAEVAHKTKTCVRTIQYTAHSLKEKLKHTPESPLAEEIFTEAGKLYQKMEGLGKYPKPLALHKTKRQINSLLKEALETAEQAFIPPDAKTTHAIEEDLAEDLPEIMVDKERLKEVFVNIILNGFQAMPEPGILTLETKELS
ncbi:MAG: hypothetical protein QME49_04085 [bacterium]|nr:hypothetical protein [bacterium]